MTTLRFQVAVSLDGYLAGPDQSVENPPGVGVLFDGRPIRHPAALPGMRERSVIVGAPSLEQRMIAWRVGWVVAPGELGNDVSRVQIYNGLVPSGFAQIGTRVALGAPDEDLAAANQKFSGGATRRSASSTASRSCGRRALGRCCSTSPPSDWTVSRCPIVCSGRRSSPPRCVAGAARLPIVTFASCSATSPSSGWRCLGRGSTRLVRLPAIEPERSARVDCTMEWQVPTLADVLKARRRILLHLRPTPLFGYAGLDELLGAKVFVKHENHQPVGAFKVRGGVNLISQLSAEERKRGVIAASTGNHGQSIAYAARLFGVQATICVPEQANPVKIASMRGLGAELVFHGRDFDAARALRATRERARLPLRALRQRAAADRGRRNGDARAPRGAAPDRRNRGSRRRRQQRGGRMHRRQGDQSGDQGDRSPVGRGAGRLPLLAGAPPGRGQDGDVRRGACREVLDRVLIFGRR